MTGLLLEAALAACRTGIHAACRMDVGEVQFSARLPGNALRKNALTSVDEHPYTLARPEVVAKGPCRRSSMAEQLFCKQQVAGSSPIAGSNAQPRPAVCLQMGRCLSG